MLPSRLRNHINNQNWSAISLELLVVILGVFIGLQVDNWNQTRIEHNAVKSYYDRLIEDLRTNAESFQARQDYYRDVQAHGQSALDTLQGSKTASPEQFLIDAYQASQLWQVSINRAAYDEILSVGAMNTIPDINSRSKLTNYHAAFAGVSLQLNTLSPYRDTVRAYIPIDIQREITANCGDDITVDEKGALQNRLPDKCQLKLDPAEASKAKDALMLAPDLKTQLTRILAHLDLKLTILGRNKDRSTELADYLEGARP